jgi:RNA polymerase sigma-70 factor (ECF subfamily)
MSSENAPLRAPEPEKARWFADQVQPHEDSLRSYLRHTFPGVRDVDDVVQESYLRVWRARASQPIQSARAFLFKVARHLAIDLVRREQVSPIREVTDFAALTVTENRPNAADAACTSHDTMMLAQAIESLPARCREVVILRKLKGVSQKEIAARLGISEQTVQVQAARGLKRCEEFLRKRGVQGPFGHETKS